ncbi:hypothetical protein G3N56_09265 [Desulfovibrio sulfodismutans]|uniref:Sel1 repeat family protein n=1 Tax=Desulfolutivibrio sulfodismutans TaxID=63561 RepID=A0A7K3NL52_9BACT|nr:hypothetical protein [Desulfolutivibrio sulfodismutans]NDY56928.1 hypothetical protein [Desulfolutivibrio sulfodismutans]QLA12949.1 hypothetical protein GD606_12050 [Desulfolutivibrio sulfodismutans DSM 3696]
MKVTYGNDTSKGPGNGIFFVRQSGFDPDVSCQFTVQRSSDKKCLSPGGWLDCETHLSPVAVTRQDDALLVCVASDVVDQLDELEVYRLTLFAPDGTKDSGALHVSGVVYSSLQGGGAVSAIPEPVSRPPEPIKPPAPEQTEITPVVQEVLPPVVETPPPVTDTDGPAAVTGGRIPRWVWILVAIIVLLGGLAVWYALSHRGTPGGEPATEAAPAAMSDPEKNAGTPQPEPAAEPEKPAAIPQAEPAAEPTPTPAPEDLAPEKAPPPAPEKGEPAGQKADEQPPLARARAFLREKGPADKALELSRSMPETPDGRDAAFLLLEAAAEGGLGEAMADLARYYDPTDPTQKGTIAKDPEQALFWYSQAKAAGRADIQGALDALLAWLRQEAEKGSAQAREILSRMR